MNIVEITLRKKLEELKAESIEVQKIIDTDLSMIFKIREKAQAILEAHRNDYELVAKLIEPLAKEERHILKICRDGSKQKAWERKFELDTDIEILSSEIYRFDMRR